jgi:hypothetical protein
VTSPRSARLRADAIADPLPAVPVQELTIYFLHAPAHNASLSASSASTASTSAMTLLTPRQQAKLSGPSELRFEYDLLVCWGGGAGRGGEGNAFV